MAQSFQNGKSGRLGMLASIAIVIGGLYFARDVLIPIALAIMLSFLLTPLLLRLFRRWPLVTTLTPLVLVACDAVLGSPLSGMGDVGRPRGVT